MALYSSIYDYIYGNGKEEPKEEPMANNYNDAYKMFAAGNAQQYVYTNDLIAQYAQYAQKQAHQQFANAGGHYMCGTLGGGMGTLGGTSQQGITAVPYGGSGGGGGTFGTINVPASVANTHPSQWVGLTTGVPIGPPTGSKVTIGFADADGCAFNVTVDAAYAAILQQISANHVATSMGLDPPMTSEPMTNGDFSMDEMDKAEQLIEELERA